MTDPLHDLTDAHLQAALDAGGHSCDVAYVRNYPDVNEAIIALARQIAATEKIAAERDAVKTELAELRAKYEPEPVDPVAVEVERLLAEDQFGNQNTKSLMARCIRRGREMQPAPFTREDADRIAKKLKVAPEGHDIAALIEATVITALTTPRAELRAMLGDG